MAPTLDIAILEGTVSVHPRWVGQHLAVTPPVKDGAEKICRGQWVITHTATGFSCATLLCSLKKATEVARNWDDLFGLISTPTDVQQWPHKKAWGETVAAINCPWVTSVSPDDSDDIAATSAAEAGRPIDQAGTVRRMLWRGQWWPLPTDTELELWVLDSVCETPDGRTVEADHPESWLSLLNLI
jgi:hypothetical protein